MLSPAHVRVRRHGPHHPVELVLTATAADGHDAGPFPDALPLLDPTGVAVQPGQPVAVWVTVTATAAARPGTRTLVVKVALAGNASNAVSVALAVRVLDFKIPTSQHASQLVDLGFSFDSFFAKSYPTAAKPARPPPTGKALLVQKKRLYTQLASFRANRLVGCGAIAARPVLQLASDKKSAALRNTTDMDELIAHAVAVGFTTFAFPQPAGCGAVLHSPHTVGKGDAWAFGHGLTVPLFLDADDGHTAAAGKQPSLDGVGKALAEQDSINPEFVRLFRLVYGAVATHLAARGWLARAVGLVIDDPTPSDPRTATALNLLAGLWRGIGVKVQLSTGGAGSSPADYRMPGTNFSINATRLAADSWVVAADAVEKPGWLHGLRAAATAGLRAGRPVEAMVYSNSMALVELPAVRTRSFPWRVWADKLDGIGTESGWYGRSLCTAGMDSWAAGVDPWANANSAANPAGGSVLPAGYATLAYPPRPAAAGRNSTRDLGLFVPSIRLEMLRQGNQDVERFALLESLVGRCASYRGCPTNNGGAAVMANSRRVLDRLGEVVWGLAPTIVATSGAGPLAAPLHTTDPQLLRAVLDQAGGAIIALQPQVAKAKAEIEQAERWRDIGLLAVMVPAVAMALGGVLAVALHRKPPPSAAAQTAAGKVEGHVFEDYVRYLAVPYGAPPTGPRRWQPPGPPLKWEGVRRQPKALPICPQASFGPFTMMFASTFEGHKIVQSEEDCLNLSVYTPSMPGEMATEILPGALHPVIVYIHGGAGKYGAGVIHDGAGLAQAGAVFVAINYRLGPLGFLAHPALSAEPANNGTSGNFALFDQIAALRWVQENIGAFGGDPQNVTIWGLSSGAQYCSTLCCSPMATGLFKRCFVQSCTDLPNVRKLKTSSTIWQGKSGEEWGVEFAKELVVTKGTEEGSSAEVAAMRTATVAQLVDSWESDAAGDMYESCVDGVLKPAGTAAALFAGDCHCKSLLIGYTADDGLGSVELEQIMFDEDDLDQKGYRDLLAREFGPEADTARELLGRGTGSDGDVDKVLSRLSRQLWYDASSHLMAKQIAADGGAAYCYVFSQPVSSMFWGARRPVAYHGADTPFWMGSDPAANATVLGSAMQQYLLAFARTGDPNAAEHGLPRWSRFHEHTCPGYIELGAEFPGSGTASSDPQPGRLIRLPGRRPFEPIDPAFPGPMWAGLTPEATQLYSLFETVYFKRRVVELLAQTDDRMDTF